MLSLNKVIADFIICCLWFFFLFGLWFIWSLVQGTEGQWWSFYYFNPEKYGPWALEISYLKIFISAFFSLIAAYNLTSWWGRKINRSSS